MSTIDKQRIAAVRKLKQLGQAFGLQRVLAALLGRLNATNGNGASQSP